METLVTERQPEIAPECIAQKIHALDWRDLQLWGIGFVVLVVLAGGFVALVTPQMLWPISAAVAGRQNIRAATPDKGKQVERQLSPRFH